MELFVRYYLFSIISSILFSDAAEILETRAVDGTDQQEYFVHYLNCSK